ncbi:transposase [endosymbiont 'TC1' of Trimyema compressum]|nr:transposase [endosymbiont 'TC1' of Trimyema compressum]
MNNYKKYDEEFKKSIVNLHQNGKTQSQLSKEYGVSMSALHKWIKLYSQVRIDDDTILTAKQIKDLQISRLRIFKSVMLDSRRKISF